MTLSAIMIILIFMLASHNIYLFFKSYKITQKYRHYWPDIEKMKNAMNEQEKSEIKKYYKQRAIGFIIFLLMVAIIIGLRTKFDIFP